MTLRVISYDGASYKQEFLDKTNIKRIDSHSYTAAE